jgi:hypothetical protein
MNPPFPYRYLVERETNPGQWAMIHNTDDLGDARTEMKPGWRISDRDTGAIVAGAGAALPNPDAAGPQQSAYDTVSTADLTVLYRALMATPSTVIDGFSSGAVLGRVRAELDRRPGAERDAAYNVLNGRRPTTEPMLTVTARGGRDAVVVGLTTTHPKGTE